MKIRFVPIRSVDVQLDYTFGPDAVTVSASTGESVLYDFSGLPDGRATDIDHGSLPMEAVLGAERIEGELYLTLLLTRGRYAPDEVRRPKESYTVAEAVALLDARNSFPNPEQYDEEEGDDDDE